MSNEGAIQNAGRDLVFTFYTESWANSVGPEMYMTGPRLLKTLMTEPNVRRLLVANPYRSAPIQWIRKFVGQKASPFPTTSNQHLVEPMRVGRRDPVSPTALMRLYSKYDRALQIAAAKLGAERPAVITTNPFVAGFSQLSWAGPVTFYAWDDWRAGEGVRQWWPAYEAAFEQIRKSRRSVIGVSQAVLDSIRPEGVRLVVPNGVVPEEWQTFSDPPTWFAQLKSPRILYVGAMISERLDVAALCDIAKRFDHGSVVLVGPIVEPRALDPLRKFSNVSIVPPVNHKEIRNIVRAAEVCVIPHLFNRLTAAMSPLKLYEYLAAGRPVAASDLPPVRSVDPRIVLVRENQSFADGIQEALARGPLCESERKKFIDANSWARRHAQILSVAFDEHSPMTPKK